MSRHVMECLGMSRVTIEDGKVVEVTEPRVRYCPLFAKRRGMEELNKESIRENIEYRISSFGMCTEDRVTTMDNFLNFGISETLCSALKNGKIDAAVIAADGCGTAVITDPSLVQGMGGRISGICETEPIPKVVEAVGRENMLDPDTARIDMEAGVDKAFSMGYEGVRQLRHNHRMRVQVPARGVPEETGDPRGRKQGASVRGDADRQGAHAGQAGRVRDEGMEARGAHRVSGSADLKPAMVRPDQTGLT